MGTTAHVLVVGDAHLVDDAFARLDDLERRWSRFLPDSEISRMNAHTGEHIIVSADTLLLVEYAINAWHRTDGLFDPTVLPMLRDAGYDRDFASVPEHAATLTPRGGRAAPGCVGIECDARLSAVTVPPGVELDPGGIGKGLAADIVTTELIESGARGALVNVGGDLRVHGEPPNGRTWDVAIDDPARNDVEILRIGLRDGAVATSSRVRRRWSTRVGEMHHLIDPRTGSPSISPYASVSAVAGEAWWAEIVAKVVLIGGTQARARGGWNAHIATVDEAGVVECDSALALVA